jgi:hypothetical protein
MRVAVGQWVVVKSSWRDEIGEVSKASEKQIRTFRDSRRDREEYHRPDSVLFVGTEKQAIDLLSVLKGLEAKHEKNRRQLNEQHSQSRDRAIAKATGEA